MREFYLQTTQNQYNFMPHPVSENLKYRPIIAGDQLDSYLGWLGDPEVVRFLEVRFARYDLEGLREYVENCNRSKNTRLFGIFLSETGEHIGNIKLGAINQHHQRGEIGLMIGGKQYWGRGFGTESIIAVTDYAFDTLGLQKVCSGCYGNNLGSLRAFLKAGYREEGRRPTHWMCENRWVDHVMLARFADDQVADVAAGFLNHDPQ